MIRNLSTCRLQKHNAGTWVLELNRPEVKNAISKEMVSELQEHIKECKASRELRTLILSSSVSKVFCSGADLKERLEMTPQQVSKFVDLLRKTFYSISCLEVPTIAVVNGVAFGGGLELAISCDFMYAGRAFVARMPETGLAIIPGAGGTQQLSRKVGPSIAKEIIFGGEAIDPQKALRIGLVARIADDPLKDALETAELYSKKGPLALRYSKMAIDGGYAMEMKNALATEGKYYKKLINTKDRIEGLDSFREKRPPVYCGK